MLNGLTSSELKTRLLDSSEKVDQEVPKEDENIGKEWGIRSSQFLVMSRMDPRISGWDLSEEQHQKKAKLRLAEKTAATVKKNQIAFAHEENLPFVVEENKYEIKNPNWKSRLYSLFCCCHSKEEPTDAEEYYFIL